MTTFFDDMSPYPPQQQQQFVSESCIDLFMIEMVDAVCRTTSTEPDADIDAAFYKLETMGYAVGQRLIEKYYCNSNQQTTSFVLPY